jgi:hypothetical protein
MMAGLARNKKKKPTMVVTEQKNTGGIRETHISLSRSPVMNFEKGSVESTHKVPTSH